jgi:hypothetical protein
VAEYRLSQNLAGLQNGNRVAGGPGILLGAVASGVVVARRRQFRARPDPAEIILARRREPARLVAGRIEVCLGVDRDVVRLKLQIVHQMHDIPITRGGITEIRIGGEQADRDRRVSTPQDVETHGNVGCRRIKGQKRYRGRVVVVAGTEADGPAAVALLCPIWPGTKVLSHLDGEPLAVGGRLDIFRSTVDRLRVRHDQALERVWLPAQRGVAVDVERGSAAPAHDAVDELVAGAGSTNVVKVVEAVASPRPRTICFQLLGAAWEMRYIGETAGHDQVYASCNRDGCGARGAVVQKSPRTTPGEPKHLVTIRAIAAGRIFGGAGSCSKQRRCNQNQGKRNPGCRKPDPLARPPPSHSFDPYMMNQSGPGP